MLLSITEENYLKAILRLSTQADTSVTTNDLAALLHTTPASVTDMLKRLATRNLIAYQAYRGARLTEQGYKHATFLIRKHRLWKVFLYQSLNIPWEAVQEIAEELEHIKSDLLIDRLDSFLGFPKFDPHGDPIPNAQGKYTLRVQSPLKDLQTGRSGLIIAVKGSDRPFLQYLTEKGIRLGQTLTVIMQDAYDQSMTLSVDGHEITLSAKVADLIMIKPL